MNGTAVVPNSSPQFDSNVEKWHRKVRLIYVPADADVTASLLLCHFTRSAINHKFNPFIPEF